MVDKPGDFWSRIYLNSGVHPQSEGYSAYKTKQCYYGNGNSTKIQEGNMNKNKETMAPCCYGFAVVTGNANWCVRSGT